MTPAAPIPIVIDSREQLPYRFPPDRVASTVAALHAGDYSLVGFETRVAIERKSLSDFLGSITAGRDRFFRELERLKSYEFAAVVVEATLEAIVIGNYRSAASPASVVGTALAIIVRYCPVFFAGDRDLGQRLTEGLLRRFWLDEKARVAETAEAGRGAA